MKRKTPVRRILLVDDDASLRGVLCDLLVAEGYIVTEVANGKVALEFLESSAPMPGLILLDLMMPVMDGFEFCKAMRRNPDIAHIGVIVMTAATQISVSDPRLEVIAVLQKPFNLDMLLLTLQNNYPSTP